MLRCDGFEPLFGGGDKEFRASEDQSPGVLNQRLVGNYLRRAIEKCIRPPISVQTVFR